MLSGAARVPHALIALCGQEDSRSGVMICQGTDYLSSISDLLYNKVQQKPTSQSNSRGTATLLACARGR